MIAIAAEAGLIRHKWDSRPLSMGWVCDGCMRRGNDCIGSRSALRPSWPGMSGAAGLPLWGTIERALESQWLRRPVWPGSNGDAGSVQEVGSGRDEIMR